MIPRSIKRRVRPMWLAMIASAAWANRQDLRRWAGFVTRAVQQRNTRPMSDFVTEAKVRAALSMDPLLRRDPELRDLAVRDGVITLFANRSDWPGSRDHLDKLSRVKGISHVETTATAVTPGDPFGPRARTIAEVAA
jgi:hypothetical protein